MQREIPLWLGVVVILVVVVVVVAGIVIWRSRPPATVTEEFLKKPPAPGVTARPGIPLGGQPTTPTTPHGY